MNERMKRLWSRTAPLLPDFRDVHIYGGLALFALSGYAGFGWSGPMLAGCALFYLGVWRLG